MAAAILAAAVVVAVALVATGDGDRVKPTDEPSPTVSVPVVPATPPQALFGRTDERLAAGTYFVDEVEGTPTPRMFVTIVAGWSVLPDEWGITKGIDIGFITFSRPDFVFADTCQWADGYDPAPVTLDGLVAALNEQRGWVDVTAPSDISVDGYSGKAFQRTAPADFSDCGASAYARFRSWRYDDGGLSYYRPGEIETLWVLDVDGTMTVLNTRQLAGIPAAAGEELAAVLDSIRIESS